MEKLELLSSVELLSQLSQSDLAVLAEHASFEEFGAGDYLYRAGTSDRELFVIDRGDVRIVRHGDDGREIDLARFVAGESFGEQDFLSEAERSASAVSETESRVLVFPRRGMSLDALMMEHPTLFARVLHQFLVIVAGRIRSMNRLVSENSGWVQELRRQVYADKLTGLLSRSYLDDEVPGILAKGRGEAALLLIKPDNFKLINDTFGHEVGDQVLRILADHLRALVESTEIAIRYRGNEFIVLVPGIPTNRGEERGSDRANQLREAMKLADLTPVTGETRVPLTFSVGVSVYPDHGTEVGVLATRSLDLALVGDRKSVV